MSIIHDEILAEVREAKRETAESLSKMTAAERDAHTQQLRDEWLKRGGQVASLKPVKPARPATSS